MQDADGSRRPIPEQVRRLVAARLRTRAELQALLLVCSAEQLSWTDRDVATALRVDADTAGRMLFDLMARGFLRLIHQAPLTYRCAPNTPELAAAVAALKDAYAADPDAVRALVPRVPGGTGSLRLFADAFRLRHEDRGREP